ncbi:MAG TPA: ABC transporter ATP-binding protein [Burkholderiaceae bacterium]|nr:ABC transporter ATP-binding protein [Burkholderiaceae bacterium]
MSQASLLACTGVSLQVRGAREPRVLVRDLHWQVEAGERWVVLGPNGAGKSTLLAALAGVRQVDGGRVLYGGAPLSAIDVLAQATRRALVTDRWHDAFSASVLQTVLTARYRFGANDAAAVAAATAALDRLDCGHLAEADIRTLSRGERQRVAIAAALAQETPVVLLDEPIAHQDPRHQVLVLDALRAAPDRTVVASLHDVNGALRFATHALLLSGRGEWSAGPAREVLSAQRMSALFATPFVALHPAGSSGSAEVLVPQSPAARDSPPL